MTAVTDTSPVCYLILIGKVDLLRELFSNVLVPRVVVAELLPDGREAAQARTLSGEVSTRGRANSLPPGNYHHESCST